jgi:hypothetical protein
MKKALYIFLFVQVLILKGNISFGQAHELDSIKIEFEGFYTETIADVSCEEFGSLFKETKKVKVIYNEHDLIRFAQLMKNFKPAKSRSFDVRGSIIYNYQKAIVKYCFDKFGYFYKDGKLYYNKNLLIAISDKVYNNHPKYLDTLRQQ